MILNIIQYGKSLTYNVTGKDHKSIIEINRIISKLFNNKSIVMKNKNLDYANPKKTILKISSKKYDLEFNNKVQTKFIDGLNKLIQWNKVWQKLNQLITL